jgi:hypothetical protein
MRRKTSYSLNIKKTKKSRDFYELIFIKLNAAKRVNNKKRKQENSKNNFKCFYCKKKDHYVRNYYKKKIELKEALHNKEMRD